MQRWRRCLCTLLLLTLLLGPCPSANAAADGSDIIFLALNDSMPYTLSASTMPYWSGGQLYVHSSTFDITSINLSASYNASNMTLLLYSGTGRRSLTFYLAEGYVQTQSGATEEVTAAMRGDQVFLEYFGAGDHDGLRWTASGQRFAKQRGIVPCFYNGSTDSGTGR